jgi:pilus assembly protein CpaB
MVTDDFVFEQQLSKKGGIAAGIPLGMRAFTIKTAQVSGAISGFLQPGDKVDVLLTIQNQTNTSGGATTLTLLAKVDVLAVDQSLEPTTDTKDAKDPRSVTLLVTQAQAVKLGLGQTKGILHLTLRNGDDNLAVPETRTTLAELGFYEERPTDEQKAPPAPAPLQVLTLRGHQEGFAIVQPSKAPANP